MSELELCHAVNHVFLIIEVVHIKLNACIFRDETNLKILFLGRAKNITFLYVMYLIHCCTA